MLSALRKSEQVFNCHEEATRTLSIDKNVHTELLHGHCKRNQLYSGINERIRRYHYQLSMKF